MDHLLYVAHENAKTERSVEKKRRNNAAPKITILRLQLIQMPFEYPRTALGYRYIVLLSNVDVSALHLIVEQIYEHVLCRQHFLLFMKSIT